MLSKARDTINSSRSCSSELVASLPGTSRSGCFGFLLTSVLVPIGGTRDFDSRSSSSRLSWLSREGSSALSAKFRPLLVPVLAAALFRSAYALAGATSIAKSNLAPISGSILHASKKKIPGSGRMPQVSEATSMASECGATCALMRLGPALCPAAGGMTKNFGDRQPYPKMQTAPSSFCAGNTSDLFLAALAKKSRQVRKSRNPKCQE